MYETNVEWFHQTEEDFLPGFERSSSYLRLLAEFDLLGQSNLEEDELSLSSLDTVELCETVSNSSDGQQTPNSHDILPEKDYLSVKYLGSMQKMGKHARSYSDITDIAAFKTKQQDCSTHKSHQQFDLASPVVPIAKMPEPEEDYSKLKVGNFTLTVDIIEAGIFETRFSFFVSSPSRPNFCYFFPRCHVG